MAPLKIQLLRASALRIACLNHLSPYFVANKKLLLTYQIYEASQFFARVLSGLKILIFRGAINAMG